MQLQTGGMQPSSKAAQSVGAAAEALFETKTVTEIRQVQIVVSEALVLQLSLLNQLSLSQTTHPYECRSRLERGRILKIRISS